MVAIYKNIVENYSKLPAYWKFLSFYLLITGVISVGFKPVEILTNRLVFILLLTIAIAVGNVLKKYSNFVQLLLAYAFLGVVYKETAIIHPLFFDKIDPYLAHIDQYLFGFQPSIEFSNSFNQKWFSELMFFGYFSYYLIPLVVMLSLIKQSQHTIQQFGTVLINSFVVYYIIFILLPAVGPQFFFPYPQNTIESQGFFADIVKLIQAYGEAPTAAFPSSHIGISVVVLLWLLEHNRKLMFIILPFSIILMFSTVYIKAHYFIDVLAGLISGTIIYFIINDYSKRSKNK